VWQSAHSFPVVSIYLPQTTMKKKACANFIHGDVLQPLLGAFAKLRKATFNVVMSVCLSVRKERFSCHWTNFNEI
jgi:hypothetical protein